MLVVTPKYVVGLADLDTDDTRLREWVIQVRDNRDIIDLKGIDIFWYIDWRRFLGRGCGHRLG